MEAPNRSDRKVCMAGERDRLRPVSVDMEGTRIPSKAQRTGRYGVGYGPCHHEMVSCFTRLCGGGCVTVGLKVLFSAGMATDIFGEYADSHTYRASGFTP